MAGDIKQKYGTIETLTVTNLHSLASSSSFTSGWTSAWIDNTSNLNINSVVYGQIKTGASPTDAKSIRVYAYAFDGTNTPDLFSSGTEGTEGAATIHDAEQLDASFVLLWSSATDNGNDQIPYTMPPRSIRQAFGFLPRKWAIFVAHDTAVNLHSSGNALYVDHEIRQYT